MYHLKIRELRYKITLIQNYRKKVRNSTSARLQEKHNTRTTPRTKPEKRQTEQLQQGFEFLGYKVIKSPLLVELLKVTL